MNLNKTKTGLLLLMFGMGCVHAQEAVPATGGDASGSNGSVSQSIGQVVYTAGTGTNGSINQGVQQPYSISSASITEASKDILLSAFPNPATDVLTLSFEDTDISGYSYAMYNHQGQLIQREEITSNQTVIPMQGLTAATYILNVTSVNEVVKTFTIIKH